MTGPNPLDLSFVADLPKSKSRDRRRCFWNVKPSGDYGKDCKAGEQFAIEYLAYDEASRSPSILSLIVEDMPRPLTGLEIGFLSIVAVAARSGAGAGRREAARIARRWAEMEGKL